MFEIIINDILTAFMLYVPYAIITGIIVITAFCSILKLIFWENSNSIVRNNKKKIMIIYILYIYCFNVVSITFLSREPGSRNGLDLEIFNSFSRNISNNVFPVENIILFIPLGFLLPLLWNKFRNAYWCMAAGFLFSLSIEVSQYVTKRGYFQIDDIITNVIGTLIGYIIVSLMRHNYKKVNKN